ncbi:hypothetical protein LAZ67_18001879, partial [Cordylochernes scorpioides]
MSIFRGVLISGKKDGTIILWGVIQCSLAQGPGESDSSSLEELTQDSAQLEACVAQLRDIMGPSPPHDTLVRTSIYHVDTSETEYDHNISSYTSESYPQLDAMPQKDVKQKPSVSEVKPSKKFHAIKRLSPYYQFRKTKSRHSSEDENLPLKNLFEPLISFQLDYLRQNKNIKNLPQPSSFSQLQELTAKLVETLTNQTSVKDSDPHKEGLPIQKHLSDEESSAQLSKEKVFSSSIYSRKELPSPISSSIYNVPLYVELTDKVNSYLPPITIRDQPFHGTHHMKHMPHLGCKNEPEKKCPFKPKPEKVFPVCTLPEQPHKDSGPPSQKTLSPHPARSLPPPYQISDLDLPAPSPERLSGSDSEVPSHERSLPPPYQISGSISPVPSHEGPILPPGQLYNSDLLSLPPEKSPTPTSHQLKRSDSPTPSLPQTHPLYGPVSLVPFPEPSFLPLYQLSSSDSPVAKGPRSHPKNKSDSPTPLHEKSLAPPHLLYGPVSPVPTPERSFPPLYQLSSSDSPAPSPEGLLPPDQLKRLDSPPQSPQRSTLPSRQLHFVDSSDSSPKRPLPHHRKRADSPIPS